MGVILKSRHILPVSKGCSRRRRPTMHINFAIFKSRADRSSNDNDADFREMILLTAM